MSYERRTPFEACGWPIAAARTLALEWSAAMAYVVGLIATDGCLYSSVRKINFKSSDRDLVLTYLQLLGRSGPIRQARSRAGRTVYFAEFGDARFHRWLHSVGLTPRKSLTLGAIAVPDEHLLPLARGLLDGDGTILNATYRADTADRTDYYWEYLTTRFSSASRDHLEWLRVAISRVTCLDGRIDELHPKPGDTRRPFFNLVYAKRASQRLPPLLYPSGAPCLERKRAIWVDYARRHGLPLG